MITLIAKRNNEILRLIAYEPWEDRTRHRARIRLDNGETATIRLPVAGGEENTRPVTGRELGLTGCRRLL